jgi:hypothetical protein
MKEGLLEKIRSRGYWRINFRPLVYVQKIPELCDCGRIIEENAVSLRGWDYPPFPVRMDKNMGIEVGENFYQGWIDWRNYLEFWRMYQSGQFIHYRALWEDWIEENENFKYLLQTIKPMTKIGIGEVICQITEIFEFLSRLARKGIYDEGVQVFIGLYNMQNRELWNDIRGRSSLSRPYKTVAKEVKFEKEFTKEQVIYDSKILAFEAIKYIFDRFGWHDLPTDSIKKLQDDFLAGKLLAGKL